MYFVEDAKGSYGVIYMTNHKQTYKTDNGLYAISVVINIQGLLMDEPTTGTWRRNIVWT